MKKSIVGIFTLIILYVIIYSIMVILEFTYNSLNIWIALFINIILIVGVVLGINRIANKIDRK
jgi:hypothetical protein